MKRGVALALLALMAVTGMTHALARADDELTSIRSLLEASEPVDNEDGPDSVPSILRRELLQMTGESPPAGAYGGQEVAPLPSPSPEPILVPSPSPEAPVTVTVAPPTTVAPTSGAASTAVGALATLCAAAAAVMLV